jgi:thiol-disulfide isomerase/thioredoxin
MVRMTLGSVLIGIVMICATDASQAASRCADPPPSLERLKPATEAMAWPDLPYLTEDGREQKLQDLAARGLVVNFWATWCAPCIKELPALNRLNGTLAADGMRVLALSSDREGAKVVRPFYDKNGLGSLDVAIDRMGKIGRALGIPGLPTTVLFDGTGREVARLVGIAEWDAPEAVAFLRTCLGAEG